METKNARVAALQRALPGRVRLEPEVLDYYSFDSLKVAFRPEAVVQVEAEEEVGTLLRLANRHGAPVTPRGGGTSRTASATPEPGGWVLDLSGLDQIRIDAGTGLARVQAGAVTAKVQAAAEAKGWFYPPDPSSRNYSTIGGNIACNAGGLRGAKYGVTRDYVVALRGYLPTGEAVQWGRDTRKFATGYNMRDLWIGSEGTLGVVTGATLRLLPLPAARATFLAGFRNEATALRAVLDLLGSRVVPSICEFMDRTAVQGAEMFTGKKLLPAAPGAALLLVEVDGHPAEVEAGSTQVAECLAARALAWRKAATAEEAEALWEVRRACSPAMFQLADSKLNEDVVVPLEKQPALARLARNLSREHGLPVAVFGHAGDGNLHVNILYHRAVKAEARAAQRAVAALMEAVVDMGGAISGEHGVGLAKTPFLRLQYRAAEVAAMRAVKQALDPKGILNPGKIFPITEIWKLPVVEHTFPWDAKG